MLKAASQPFVIDDFSMGLDWSSIPAKVQPKWLVNAKNVNLTSTRSVEKRKGCAAGGIGAGSEGSAQIDTGYVTTIHEYRAPDGTDYFLAICKSNLYYWKTVGGWTSLKGSLTANLRASVAQTNGYCFFANGTDAMWKLRNTTVSALGVAEPEEAPTVTLGAVTRTEREDDYTFSVTNYYALRDTATDTTIAQTIMLSEAGIFTGITLWLRKVGSPTGNLWLELWTDDNGKPGEQVGTDSATLDVSTISEEAHELLFTDPPPPLLPSTKYWLLVKGDYTINGSAYIRIGRSASADTYQYGYSYRLNASDAVTYLGPDLYMKLTYDIPDTDVLTGRYKWVYAFRNSSGQISNLSPPSEVQSLESQSVTVSCHYSEDTSVEYLILYRCFDMGPDEDPVNVTQYFKVSDTTANDPDLTPSHYAEIADSVLDKDLTTLAENNNTVPPLAKYLVVFQDRLIFANCPSETDGGSLFMFSKAGQPESCPSSNYQYFDRDDGNQITGVAALPNYLVVFKKNKIAAMTSDFSEWSIISDGIGCIAPWAILTMTDKIIFLSEEGIKATDGHTVYDIGKKLFNLARARWWSEDNSLKFTSVYYPDKKQFFINYYGTYKMLVGHWLASLYMDMTPEFAQQDNYVGWTYHDYENGGMEFYTLGTFTDSTGVTRVVAGTNDGYIFRLDCGAADNGENIDIAIETGYFALGGPTGIDKTVRSVNVTYAQSDLLEVASAGTVKMYVDTDFTRTSDYVTLSTLGVGYTSYGFSNAIYGGPGQMTTENFNMVAACTGKLFSFRFEDSSQYDFSLLGIEAMYRFEGIR